MLAVFMPNAAWSKRREAISAIEIYSAIGGVTRLWKLCRPVHPHYLRRKIKREREKSEKCASGEAARAARIHV